MIFAGVIRIRHGGSEESYRCQSSKWVTGRFTESPDVPTHSVLVQLLEVQSRQVSKHQRTAVNEHLSGNSKGRKEDPWSGVFVLGVQKLLRSPKAFAVVDDPNAKHIYAFFFHRERYPATHLPIQLGLPTRTILSKHSSTFASIIDCEHLGDHTERPDCRVSLST